MRCFVYLNSQATDEMKFVPYKFSYTEKFT